MRVLMWHCDSFKSEMTEKGRSPLREELTEKIIETGPCLLIYVACEKQDQADPPAIIQRATAEVTRLARQLKVDTIVLHSFAHLFVELSAPQTALDILKGMEATMQNAGLTVHRTPFGWFNTLEIKAKGHPISRVAREIRVGGRSAS